MNLKTKFLKIYANLSLNQRNEIVVVVDNEPLTWNSARIEVENNTQKGKEILEKLASLGIINEKTE
ncbi:MAG: hypothetical protein UU34_C0012G0010 [Candidatus Curtissbacteria bacterium GW2011_GWA1_41_11]|uniref:Uncharacterized protein n=1 Tax=Candidatus Curtissbacteria bacterium GW2011_GWA1_41_11 TaxID=1618409 RepID=A0A0G0XFX3_9BACT|nr:MAG: hypothetical protein UU34_C0012G0010 [Candidatus Curtissbacteria bacterium GW2011_GWA1_41_11]